MQSADKESSLIVQAIGELPSQASDRNIYNVHCYYSASADGTLISANALCQQYHTLYYGFHIYGDMEAHQGELVLLGWEGIDDLVFTTYQETCCGGIRQTQIHCVNQSQRIVKFMTIYVEISSVMQPSLSSGISALATVEQKLFKIPTSMRLILQFLLQRRRLQLRHCNK